MLSSAENTFLKYLDAICDKYKEVDEENDSVIDFSLIKTSRKARLRAKHGPLYTAPPAFFSFIKRRRVGDKSISRFGFVNFRERFNRLYKVFHEEPTFDDLSWMYDGMHAIQKPK